jgi:hypothetical protein
LKRERVGREVEARRLTGEQRPGRTPEIDRDFGYAPRHAFAGAQVKRHALPAPIVDREAQRRVGLGVGLGRDRLLLEVTLHGFAAEHAGRVLRPRHVTPPGRS